MANDINRVLLIGRLTKDPELRYTQGGTAVASFSLASNRSYTAQNEKKEQVSFFNCVVWGKPGEITNQYMKKGMKVGIEGRLQQRSWQDQSGARRNTVEIVVENFQFLSAGNGQQGEQGAPADDQPRTATEDEKFDNQDPAQPSASYYTGSSDNTPSHFSDEDIPF
jgi:single-strand DNA-binding protein